MSLFGLLSDTEWHKLWPIKKIPELTSPPKGRNYSQKHKKNIHNLSLDSDSSVQEVKSVVYIAMKYRPQ